MEAIVGLLRIDYTIATVLTYRLSLIEAVGILTGLLSVYFATRMNSLTWSIGLINVSAFFCLFYQVQLYSDMALQLFFAGVTVYGWSQWGGTRGSESPPTYLDFERRALAICGVVTLTIALGITFSSIHIILPTFFPIPAAFPFQDAFTAAASVVATFLLAQRFVETWVLWIAVDIVSIFVYSSRGIPFMGALYFVFLVLAISGFRTWQHSASQSSHTNVLQESL